MSEFLPPIEIPWKLLRTSRPLAKKGADSWEGPTISLFSYSPQSPELKDKYPKDRIVYYKITVSVQPINFGLPGAWDEDTIFSDFAKNNFLMPIKRVVLDLKVTRGKGAKEGDEKPYFIAAAPMRREMLETGVIGLQSFSGNSDALSVGKSGSTLHESYTNSTTTSSGSEAGGAAFGAILPPVGFVVGGGFSHSSSSVDTTGSRDVSQTVDVTQRQATDERRELLSHTTNVNNILTLLSTHHIGSPYLRFFLSPRPLQPLALDPSSTDFWYDELIRYRSSGIEGTQEFFAVVIAAENEDVCVEASLTLVHCLSSMIQFTTDESYLDAISFSLGANEQKELDIKHKTLAYLNEKYPPGFPLDELDIDIKDMFISSTVADFSIDKVSSPTLQFWNTLETKAYLINSLVIFSGLTSSPGNKYHWINGLYKPVIAVFLEAWRAEREKTLLEAATTWVPVLISYSLTYCEHEHRAGSIASSVPSGATKIPSGELNGSVRPKPQSRGDVSTADYRRTFLLLNEKDRRLTNNLLSAGPEGEELKADDPDLINLLLYSLANMDPAHSSNLPIERATKVIGLNKDQLAALKRKGVDDLQTLAYLVVNHERIERLNKQIETVARQSKELNIEKTELKPLSTLSRAEISSVHHAFAGTLKPRAIEPKKEGGRRKTTERGRRE